MAGNLGAHGGDRALDVGVVGADLGTGAIPGPTAPAQDADRKEDSQPDDGAAAHYGSTDAGERRAFIATRRLPP